MKNEYSTPFYSLFLSFLFLISGGFRAHAQLPDEFAKVDLVTGLENATSLKFLPDGRIVILERFGEILIYKPDTQIAVSAGTLPVFHQLEDGLVGIAVDPNFESNNKIYLHYSANDFVGNRVSRFSLVGDEVDFSSEEILLQWPTSRTAAYHSGGDMDFDSQGNLFIATGDNSGYPTGGYTAINEENADESAEKSSSNTDDLRGKILRITPGPGASYTIPSGNLFQNASQGRPEIYVMGARNPYRIHVDKQNNDWLFWAEVGPDAPNSSPRGPLGLDEINLTKTPGNYGWPYFSGTENDPYLISYADDPYYNNAAAPVNISQWNTGATELPPARPAWIDKPSECYLVGFRYNYDPQLPDDQRLPEEFDDLLIYYDFNSSRIWAIDTDVEGNLVSEQQVAPGVFPDTSDGYIDMEVGPDGKMYIIAYGAGCCPDNVGSGRLIRVDYTGITTNSPPNVVLEADVSNGPDPLTVNFMGGGTTDPNDDSPLTYSWDFEADGIVDSNEVNPSHTYNTPGTYTAQLKVDDGQGGVGARTVVIYAGNTLSNFEFVSPADGGLFGWNDDIDVDLNVTDAEEGTIPCAEVDVVPSVGHVNHFHDDLTIDGCPKTITISDKNHTTDGKEDIFFVMGANYTDSGGLTSRDQIQLHPKRKEAEYYDRQSGTEVIPNSATFGGGNSALSVNDNGYISFSGRNLINMTAVKYLVASDGAGGTIELRTGSPTGTLVATTEIPNTGDNDDWVEVQTPITDPGGKNDLFFVFKGTSGQDIFRLNYVEFVGAGVSTDNSSPEVISVKLDGNSQVTVLFSEYIDQNTAQVTANYVIDNGINVSSAVLQSDNRTVVLTTSPLSTGIEYNLTISNVQNTVGLPVVADSFAFSVFEEIRINAGGGEVTLNGATFSADQYNQGGQEYINSTPIEGTADDPLYQTERYADATNDNVGTGGFGYEIPVGTAGEYDIRLHFAEIYYGAPGGTDGGPGSRIFDVVIEGEQVLTDFDILAETEPATVLLKEFDNISIDDGFASIILNGVKNGAKINGIEVLSPDTFGGGNTDADITITSPSNGWDVKQPFDVAFRVENWVVNENDTHLHYFVDGTLVDRYYGYEPIPIDGYSLGEHTIRVELFNADHTGTGIFDEVTVNITDENTCNKTPFPDSWTVHELEANEYTVVYTFADYDLDGDGLKDIVTGGWWFKNPGSASGDWEKRSIAEPFGNVAHVYDFDGDGDMDLLGTTGTYEGVDMVWARNDGEGNFEVFDNIPAGDDSFREPFLAGLAGGVFDVGGPYQMAINWNGAEETGSPVQMLTPPADVDNITTETWSLVDISPDSSGEDIQAGDIDQDGDLDLFQGINWLRNNGNNNFETFDTGITYTSTPDRAQLADFDRNGTLDAVVGQLGIGGSDPYQFSWFSAPTDPTQPWIRNVLDTDIRGSLSVFATDIDFDGDPDIVVGEWLGQHRLIAFENDLCGSGEFNLQVLDDGGLDLEHHDGARVTDIDNDGDLDVISNGWRNDLVPRIYENTTAPIEDNGPIVDAGQDRNVALDTSFTLTGSANDPDGGDIVSYLWTEQSAPPGSTTTLSGTDTTELTVGSTVAGTYVFRLSATDDEGDTNFDEVTVSVGENTPGGGGNVTRINAGGPTYIFEGNTWSADQYSNGGTVFTNDIAISNTDNDQLYQTERYREDGNGSLIYEIPVANGEHTVNLHFAEIYFGLPSNGGVNGGAGSRVFNIDVEGQGQRENYDIFDAAGGTAIAIVETFSGIMVEDESLTITLAPVTEFPKISGIEVVVPESGILAIAEAAPTAGEAPFEVTFTGSNSMGDIASYLWDFKDGNTSTDADPAHTFLAGGTYEVALTVSDAGGMTDTATISIAVGETDDGEVMGVFLESNPPEDGIAVIRIMNQPENFMMLGINVHDIQGRLLNSYKPEDILVDGTTYQVPVHILKAGLYFFEIAMNQGEPVTLKVLVKN